MQLQAQSRTMTAINPARDWSWEKETQSRILMKLDEVACVLVNTNLKKGKKRAKPDEQFQPDYVKDAKEEARKKQKKQKFTDEEMDQIKAFWQKRNPNITKVINEQPSKILPESTRRPASGLPKRQARAPRTRRDGKSTR